VDVVIGGTLIAEPAPLGYAHYDDIAMIGPGVERMADRARLLTERMSARFGNARGWGWPADAHLRPALAALFPTVRSTIPDADLSWDLPPLPLSTHHYSDAQRDPIARLYVSVRAEIERRVDAPVDLDLDSRLQPRPWISDADMTTAADGVDEMRGLLPLRNRGRKHSGMPLHGSAPTPESIADIVGRLERGGWQDSPGAIDRLMEWLGWRPGTTALRRAVGALAETTAGEIDRVCASALTTWAEMSTKRGAVQPFPPEQWNGHDVERVLRASGWIPLTHEEAISRDLWWELGRAWRAEVAAILSLRVLADRHGVDTIGQALADFSSRPEIPHYFDSVDARIRATIPLAIVRHRHSVPAIEELLASMSGMP